MQKIKNSILSKMIERKLTSKEIDFLLYISRFQDDNGRIDGIHYKEVCEKMHMSYQGFYNIKNSLIEKGMIVSEKSNRIDHDITILGNSFHSQEDIGNGYINTNHNIFYQEEFYKLKAGSKLLAMELMKLSYAGTGECCIGVEKFYEKYTKMFLVCKRVIRGYLMALKAFFSIGIKNGLYYMRPKRNVYRQPGQKSENENYAAHSVEMHCRRNRIKNPEPKELYSVITLVKQYKNIAKEAKRNVFQVVGGAIEKSIEVMNQNTSDFRIRKLKPKLIHILVRKELGLL